MSDDSHDPTKIVEDLPGRTPRPRRLPRASTPRSPPRDVLVVALAAALARMEIDKLTVGKTAELMIEMMEREGYAVQLIKTKDRHK
jgi:hypothetical protein